MRKWLEEIVLLNQEHVNSDKHGGQTIEDLRAATASKTGENIQVRRFVRFKLGEGIEKRQDDFASEVMAQAAR